MKLGKLCRVFIQSRSFGRHLKVHAYYHQPLKGSESCALAPPGITPLSIRRNWQWLACHDLAPTPGTYIYIYVRIYQATLDWAGPSLQNTAPDERGDISRVVTTDLAKPQLNDDSDKLRALQEELRIARDQLTTERTNNQAVQDALHHDLSTARAAATRVRYRQLTSPPAERHPNAS